MSACSGDPSYGARALETRMRSRGASSRAGIQKIPGTSTHSAPSRIVSLRVISCRRVFGRRDFNWRKKNPAYAPLSAHLSN
jgi:hypothetical protein